MTERSEAKSTERNFASKMDVGRSRSQLWTPFTILWTPFTILQKLWTAPPEFSKIIENLKFFLRLYFWWLPLVKVKDHLLDNKFLIFKSFWGEAHEITQRLRVFHAHPLTYFSCNSYNKTPLGAGLTFYSGQKLYWPLSFWLKEIFSNFYFWKNF